MCSDPRAAADSVTAGAPEQEIEITPEMIEAGVRILEDNLMEDTIMGVDWFRRELVCDIFREMIIFWPGRRLLREGSE